MHLRFITLAALGMICILFFPTQRCPADPPTQKSNVKTTYTPQQGKEAVEKGLNFLDKDGQKWRKEHQCSTCHHGAMTVWAISEAKSRGFAVNTESLTEMTQWTKTRFIPSPDQPLDPRPGFNIPSMAAAYLMLANETNKDSLTPEEGKRIAKHIVERQEADGAWPIAPPANGPPPVFESRETSALWYYLALEPAAHADPATTSSAQSSRDKADAWLKKIEPGDTTQTAALRLIIETHASHASNKLRPAIKQLLDRQNADGGWSQIKTLSSDAYATGLALYALNQAGIKNNRPEIQRGLGFLISNQKEDGSWPMLSRETPERKPAKNIEPIVHSGSAWAVIGMVRSLPKQPTRPAQEKTLPTP